MILVGTSGWNYPTGPSTWNGVFYPSRRSRGFDELAYYAEHFDTVEVNSTFYRMPEPDLSRGWIARTPAAFQFAVKLYQKFTHPDMYLAHDGVSDWDLSRTDIDLFRRGVEPLSGAGRLASVLLQFPVSFHAEGDTRGYLEWLLTGLAGYPLAVELRHDSWDDAGAGTGALLEAHGASRVIIDAPGRRNDVGSHFLKSGNDSRHHFLYFRFHGRNAAQWWQHEHRDDRYDYLYSAAELRPFADKARAAAGAGRRVLMYMNNHFSAKAVANAALLRHALDQPVPGTYPVEMTTRYPELQGVVATSGLPL